MKLGMAQKKKNKKEKPGFSFWRDKYNNKLMGQINRKYQLPKEVN